MKKPKYTIEQVKDAVISSYSIASVLNILGLVAAGGNYATIKRIIKTYNLDNSHFTGMGHLKGKTYSYRTKPLSFFLKKNSYILSHRLKLRLIKEGIKSHICEKCGLEKWNEKPIPLELHHMDGDRLNNEIENLQLLCPNCHAQTDNYRGKNKS